MVIAPRHKHSGWLLASLTHPGSGEFPYELDDEDGSYFIDRDGRHFHHVLAYLRDPNGFVPPSDAAVCVELLREAHFYRIVRGPVCACVYGSMDVFSCMQAVSIGCPI
jgi:hypothetical protein